MLFLLLTGCADPCPERWTEAAADPESAALEAFVLAHLDRLDVAGAGIALLRDDEVFFAGGFGLADTSEDQPVVEDTSFVLASVAKIFTSSSVWLTAEAGGLDPAADVSELLGWDLVHPSGEPITAEQLIEHRGGIVDDDRVLWGHYEDGDHPEALGDWVFSVLHPDGHHYDPAVWSESAPGEQRLYSNTGYALLGYLVELAEDRPFRDVNRDQILDPLYLEHSAWRLDELDEANVAHPHKRRVPWPGQRAIDHYGYPDYPNGLLRSSPSDVARFLVAARTGALGTTAARAFDERVGWSSKTLGGRQLTGHSGSDTGARADAWIDPDDGSGVVLLLNGRLDSDGHRASLACLLDGLANTAFDR